MPFLSPIMDPLLVLPPLWIVIIISLVVTLIITLIYKWTTDQNLMKQLKDEMKEFQKEMKELKQHPEKMMEVQKKDMQTNMKYMMHSMKSTLFTFIPIILIFGWMNANVAYEPINPGENFAVDAFFAKGITGAATLNAPNGIDVAGNKSQSIIDRKTSWVLKGMEKDYKDADALSIEFNGKTTYKGLIITTKQRYAPVIESYKGGDITSIKINNPPM